MSTRRQLTLFVPSGASGTIEAVRQRLDQVQHRLIAAPVTVCREHEITPWSSDRLRERAKNEAPLMIELAFGPPVSFFEHGVKLDCVAGQDRFQALRERLLAGRVIAAATAHITLAHPRNPRSAGNAYAAAGALVDGVSIGFDKISLIEQVDDQPWQSLWSV
ncbi:hypothetical protein BH10PSE17_BH10PSE17_23610 [soil metagenome]